LQAVIDRSEAGSLDARVTVVISNNSGAGALVRGDAHGIPTAHLSRATHPEPDKLDSAVLDTLVAHGVEWVILAGYMRPLGPRVIEAYRDRILNIHPALLPSYGGRGMYGSRVHEAVIAAGETESGVTVHLVTDEYDAGPPVAQRRVPVESGDTPDVLQARVLELEHGIYADVIQAIADGTLTISDGTPSGILS
jgi:phosphoribosylglycinamide formyltransferase 1